MTRGAGAARARGTVRATLVLVPAVLLALLFGGCQAILEPEGSVPADPTPVLSGIRGIVHLGPTCEGATRASPCVVPYRAALVILDAEDGVVARVASADDGRFEVALPPGVYTIQPEPPGADPFPYGDPVSVVVGEEMYTDIGVNYDTGIR